MTLQYIIIQEQNKLKWKNNPIKINYRLQHNKNKLEMSLTSYTTPLRKKEKKMIKTCPFFEEK